MTEIAFGNGNPALVTLGDGRVVFGKSAPNVIFNVNGSVFNPTIQLVSGSNATVTWRRLDKTLLATGLNPTINFGSPGLRSVYMSCTNLNDIVSLNLGFDNTQDAGRAGPSASYNKAAQPVVGITGVNYLTNLVQFLAANTPLTGHLDLSNLHNLQYVECFQAKLTSIVLTGCTSLIRLCLEANKISSINLNPVASTLQDLRIAVQDSTALDFVPLTAPINNLWHFCVRDQVVTRMPTHIYLPAVEQHWAWNTDQSYSDAPISHNLNSYLSYENTYNQESVDRILTGLVSSTSGGGYLDLTGSSTPSSTGLAAVTTLRGRGWTVLHS